MFQSFSFYPEQEDRVSRPFQGHPEELCAEMLKGTEGALSWLLQLLGHGFLALSPFLNKPRKRCNVKKRKTQVPRCSNSWRQETGMNSNPFFLYCGTKEIRIFMSIQLSIEKLYSAQWGRPCKFLYTVQKHVFILHLKGSPCQSEKNQCLKTINKLYF